MSLINDDIFLQPRILKFSNLYSKLNTYSNKKEYTFEFELPGIDKKDIKVSIDNYSNVLKVTGNKQKLSKEKSKELISAESYYGSFARAISLPEDIDKDNIESSFKNGILKIIIKKDNKKMEDKIKYLKIN